MKYLILFLFAALSTINASDLNKVYEINLDDDDRIGKASAFLLDSSGTLYVRDSQEGGVHKFDQKGVYTKIGKVGQGPHEISSRAQPYILEKNQIGFVTGGMRSPSFKIFSAQGKFLSQPVLPFKNRLRRLFLSDKGRFYVTSIYNRETSIMTLKISSDFDSKLDKEIVDTYWSERIKQMRSRGRRSGGRMVAEISEQFLFHANNNQIIWMSNQDDIIHKWQQKTGWTDIKLDGLKASKPSEKDKDFWFNYIKENSTSRRTSTLTKKGIAWPELMPKVSQIFIDEQNRIWYLPFNELIKENEQWIIISGDKSVLAKNIPGHMKTLLNHLLVTTNYDDEDSLIAKVWSTKAAKSKFKDGR